MICDICNMVGDHNPRCPNYTPPKSTHHCSICEDGIYEGEEYIENLNGEFIHYECVKGLRHLLEWLGYDIKTMEDLK